MTIAARLEANRIAVIRARWHAGIVDQCVNAFVAEWQALGGTAAEIDIVDVPGALKSPFMPRRLPKPDNIAPSSAVRWW